jgi:hypothetical protein
VSAGAFNILAWLLIILRGLQVGSRGIFFFWFLNDFIDLNLMLKDETTLVHIKITRTISNQSWPRLRNVGQP